MFVPFSFGWCKIKGRRKGTQEKKIPQIYGGRNEVFYR